MWRKCRPQELKLTNQNNENTGQFLKSRTFKIMFAAQMQGLTITIKLPHLTMYVCQNFGQIPKSIYQVPCPLPSDFPNNFS